MAQFSLKKFRIFKTYEFIGQTPDGKPGLKFRAKYGMVGIDSLNKDIILDGMNEKGLASGTFYHPNIAEYMKYNKDEASKSIAPTQLLMYVLSQFKSIDEVREGLKKVNVVPVIEPALGIPTPMHMIVTDPDGTSIVVEFIKGKTVIHDNPLGVITNAPAFDWHITNLQNYLGLSSDEQKTKKLAGKEFKPLGVGSGMIGMPGDFTPPSRFVRAVVFTQTSRPSKDGEDVIYEAFRILDNFNVPLFPGEDMKDLKSSTAWTSIMDTKNLLVYYHTQNNRRVRMFDLKKIDFGNIGDKSIHIPMDKVKKQDIEIVEMPK